MYLRAFSTLGCGELTLEQASALATRHQVDAIELRALEGTIDLPRLFAARFGAGHGSGLMQTGARVAALDTSFRLLDGSKEDRDKLLEFVPWAEAFGAAWLRIFDGGRALDDAALEHAADTLAWWSAVRRQRSLRANLMIETHDVLLDAARIRRFMAAMPVDVHLLWDAHHTWRRGGEDPEATWSAIGRHVVHIHVKDSTSTSGEGTEFSYVLPGAGEFPMARLRERLRREFSGALSLEWEKFWQPDLAPLDDVLQAAADHRWW